MSIWRIGVMALVGFGLLGLDVGESLRTGTISANSAQAKRHRKHRRHKRHRKQRDATPEM
jgi:hypothetical protein